MGLTGLEPIADDDADEAEMQVDALNNEDDIVGEDVVTGEDMDTDIEQENEAVAEVCRDIAEETDLESGDGAGDDTDHDAPMQGGDGEEQGQEVCEDDLDDLMLKAPPTPGTPKDEEEDQPVNNGICVVESVFLNLCCQMCVVKSVLSNLCCQICVVKSVL